MTAPPPPVPPAEQQPQAAKVTFTHGQVSIDATNASLMQILNQISQQTGMVVQGLDHDERIYGKYGPDAVSGTLQALLNGTGYNYVIIGGGTEHTPATLQLTPANATGSSSSPPITAGAASATDPQTTTPANGSDPTPVKPPQEF